MRHLSKRKNIYIYRWNTHLEHKMATSDKTKYLKKIKKIDARDYTVLHLKW